MKNKIWAVLVLFALIGCESLEEEAYTFITPSKFYKTEADANASCIGLYEGVDVIDTYNVLNGLGCVAQTNDGRYIYHNEGDISLNDELMNRMWQQLYYVVRKANTTIDNLEASNIDKDVKNRYIAEAKVVRAHTYFRIVRCWGDVPALWTASFDSDDIPLTPMEDIYAQIIEDLEWAKDYVWKRGEKPEGRVNQSTTKTILAKVYLTLAHCATSYNAGTSAKGLKPYNDAFSGNVNEYLQNCKTLCQEVIDGPYKLLDNWMDQWGRGEGFDNRNNDEAIWSSQTAPGLYGHIIGNRYTPINSEYVPAGLGVYQGMAYDWVISFDTNDIRYTDGLIWQYQDMRFTDKVTIQNWRRDINDPLYPEDDATVVLYESADTIIQEQNYWVMAVKKWVDRTYEIEGVGAAINIPYYRMAEVYLMYAEAENELNGCTQEAVDKINAVRSRCNVPTYTAGQFSKEEFRERILDELLWEFGQEAKDWFDLCRFGQLEERCYGVGADPKGEEKSDNPRPRDADDYWLPFGDQERGLNSFLKDVARMDYN
jgi:hypothetical protein